MVTKTLCTQAILCIFFLSRARARWMPPVGGWGGDACQNGEGVVPDKPSARWGQTAAYLPKQEAVLFVGGQKNKKGNITDDVFALDVKSDRWTRLSSEGLPPNAFAASTVTDGEKLWLIGGITQDGISDAPAYLWMGIDLTQGKWMPVNSTDTPMGRKGAKAVPLSWGKIMVVGGTSDASGKIPEGRTGHSSVLTLDGRVIIHGGYTDKNKSTDQVYVLDVQKAESSRPDVGGGNQRAYHSAVMTGNIMAVAFGEGGGKEVAKADDDDDDTALSVAVATGSNIQPVAETQQQQPAVTMQQSQQQQPATATEKSQQSPATTESNQQQATTSDQATNDQPASDSQAAITSPSDSKIKGESVPPGSDDTNSNPSQKSAIAGSLLGAAAVTGGLYAYCKRREAAAYQQGQDFVLSPPRGPPVSNLWFHGLRRAASPAILRHGGSDITSPRAESDKDSVMVNVGNFTTPPSSTLQVKGVHRRADSTDSLASHFSYPNLANMHRGNGSEVGRQPVPSSVSLSLSTPEKSRSSLDSDISLDGESAFTTTLYPWQTLVQPPARAKVVDSHTRTTAATFLSIDIDEETVIASAMRSSSLTDSMPRTLPLADRLRGSFRIVN